MTTALGKPTVTTVAQVSRDFKAKDRRAIHAKEIFNARINRAQSDYAETMREIWSAPETQAEAPTSQATSAPATTDGTSATA